jgi:hypothetical protein
MEFSELFLQARELREKIARAWGALEAPQLDPGLKSDWEIGPYFKHLVDRRWDELDLKSKKLGGGCWHLWLPKQPQVYYLAAFLTYCLDLERHGGRVDYQLFASAISGTIDLEDANEADGLSMEMRSCVLECLNFLHDNLECFFNNDPGTRANIERAIWLWTRNKE